MIYRCKKKIVEDFGADRGWWWAYRAEMGNDENRSIEPKPDAALIVVGHGSTENPDSSAPTFLHADELRRRGIFAEVVCAFWKEEPSLREVYRMIDSEVVYVVPNFISEGYFTREVIPRELELDGAVTQVDGREVRYCDPVGIHASMTDLILHRAGEVAPGVDPAECSLIIVGHGTKLNAKSTEAIVAQVERVRAGDAGFAEVVDAYMEEAPFVSDWDGITASPNVVIVPFFIADGLHSYQDIPVMLGIEKSITAAASQREVFRENPYQLRGRTLFYSSAVGTDSLMPGVILDQVAAFDAEHLREVGA